jgi:hypothetical protein
VEGRGGPRIAFVGGGSYQWGPKIIQDVALNEWLRGGALVLHDINGEALEDMYQCGTRALDVARADLKLEKTLKIEVALRGADFVVLSISTGSLDATTLDLEIPARYGIVQTVGDTVGPGGLFRGLQNMPVIVEIARDGEALSRCRTVELHQPANGSDQGRHQGLLHKSRRALSRAVLHPRHAIEDVRCARGNDQREGCRDQPLYLGDRRRGAWT